MRQYINMLQNKQQDIELKNPSSQHMQAENGKLYFSKKRTWLFDNLYIVLSLKTLNKYFPYFSYFDSKPFYLCVFLKSKREKQMWIPQRRFIVCHF